MFVIHFLEKVVFAFLFLFFEKKDRLLKRELFKRIIYICKTLISAVCITYFIDCAKEAHI